MGRLHIGQLRLRSAAAPHEKARRMCLRLPASAPQHRGLAQESMSSSPLMVEGCPWGC